MDLDPRGRPKRHAVLCDIDGTVALMGKGEPGRRKFYEWDRVGEDDPSLPIISLLYMFRRTGLRTVFISGRDEICRNETEEWLLKHQVIAPGHDVLLMRQHKDNRPDHEIKLEIYKRNIEPFYHIAYVLDDRNQVVKMWRELGLTVLQVADGDF